MDFPRLTSAQHYHRLTWSDIAAWLPRTTQLKNPWGITRSSEAHGGLEQQFGDLHALRRYRTDIPINGNEWSSSTTSIRAGRAIRSDRHCLNGSTADFH